jgi:hypothetical protein
MARPRSEDPRCERVVLRFTVSELASLKVAAGERAVSDLCRSRALGEASGSAKDGLTDDGRSPVAEGLARPASPRAPAVAPLAKSGSRSVVPEGAPVAELPKVARRRQK